MLKKGNGNGNGNGRVNNSNNPTNPRRRQSVVSDPEHYPELQYPKNAKPSFINNLTQGPSNPGNKNSGGKEYFGPETQYPRNAKPLTPNSPYEPGASNLGGHEYIGPFFKASPQLQQAVNVTSETPLYVPSGPGAKALLAKAAVLPPKPARRLLASSAPPITIGAVGTLKPPSTRRRKNMRKSRKSKKSRKNRK